MTTLQKPPLIEAIFELKWGKNNNDNTKPGELSYSQEEISLFAGKFSKVAESRGFNHLEEINEQAPKWPHIVRHRFRKHVNQWPCYQIGLGIFTTNQVEKAYDWKPFKEAILNGLEIIDESYTGGLNGLSALVVELKYQDGFIFQEKDSPLDFIAEKLRINFDPPKSFLNFPKLDKKISQISLSFTNKLNAPAGFLIIDLKQALINGKAGFLMQTIVRSADHLLPELNTEGMAQWLDQTHEIQKHAFNSLISLKLAETFQ